ncbi:hypothetical protein HOLleu_00600 [Holothuria leucospilota]|uniref:Reverse transcriptase n=1 Tax=Holothuria leucospilota TaxID=206669 RepID=A0A9Q1HKC4_HOLLE|nr:hypothetical protein HOLleu_00600 [Holothuria leucospilota]
MITPCDSEWVSPIVMVHKPDGTYRLAIDHRALTAVSKHSCYPITAIDIFFMIQSYFQT